MAKWSADKIVKRKLLDLIPYERNSKIHPDSQIDQLVKSIEEWGFTIPILIDENNNVISGHGRLFAADRLELKSVPCIVAKGWTDEQRRAYVIADNKLAEKSIWNDDLLYVEMNELLESGYDIELLAVDLDSPLEFAPNVTPLFQPIEVTGDDVVNAGGKLQDQVDGLGTNRAAAGVEVMCPHCTGTFKVAT